MISKTQEFFLQHKTSIQGVFRIYRLTLPGLLAATSALNPGGKIFADANSSLFFGCSMAWALLALTSGILSRKYPETTTSNTINLTIDMLALAVLGWSAGGLNSGLLYLMLPSAAIAGLMLPARLALFVAAVASISVLFTQGFLYFTGHTSIGTLFPAGLMGIMLFACTAAFKTLENRVAASEARAAKSDEKAAEYRQLSEAVITQMISGVLVIDGDCHITMINPSAEKMLAATNSLTVEIEGTSLDQFPQLKTRYLRWKDDSETRISSFTHSFSGLDLQPDFRDISQGTQERTLITLEDTRLIRQQAQQAKVFALGKLSASLAHEVRNPLSAINQANDLLTSSSNLDSEERKLVDIITRHCERMDQTIDVANQLSRGLEPQIISFELGPWMNQFITEYRESQTEPCEIHMNLGQESVITFDPQHLTQILRNLIDNGLRYSEAYCGKKDVAILSSYDRAKRLIFIDIHDRGLGIPREEVDEVFAPFHSTSKGAGIGLYVCRELCDANFASINYLYKSDDQESGFFRLTAWIKQPNQ